MLADVLAAPLLHTNTAAHVHMLSPARYGRQLRWRHGVQPARQAAQQQEVCTQRVKPSSGCWSFDPGTLAVKRLLRLCLVEGRLAAHLTGLVQAATQGGCSSACHMPKGLMSHAAADTAAGTAAAAATMFFDYSKAHPLLDLPRPAARRLLCSHHWWSGQNH